MTITTLRFVFAGLITLCFLGKPGSTSAACSTHCTRTGTTVTCSDISTDCIQDAVDNVAQAGDVIEFPASGSATWSSTVIVQKNLTIDGNGTTITAGGALPYGVFRITGFSSTDLMRITGFTFNLLALPVSTGGITTDSVTLTKLRIDNNTFNLGNYVLEIGGAWGVIDNNRFYNTQSVCDLSAGTRAQADASWENLNPGGANALFLENNHFVIDSNWPYPDDWDNGNACDAYQGGTFVYRYNTFDYTATPSTVRYMGTITPHGSASGGCPNGYWQSNDCARRSPALMEVYNNRMVGRRIAFIFGFRGGSALIFKNYHLDSDGGTAGIGFTEEEFRTDEDGQCTPTRSAWPGEDMINNTFIWDNILDGVLQSDDNISVLDFNSYCTESGTPITCCTGSGQGTCNDGQANAIITKDREYFMHAPQDSGGSSSWVCASGISECNGSSSSYPTNGSVIPSFGNQVFNPNGPNAYYPYSPYQCPHPLTGLTGSCDPDIAGTEGYNINSGSPGPGPSTSGCGFANGTYDAGLGFIAAAFLFAFVKQAKRRGAGRRTERS